MSDKIKVGDKVTVNFEGLDDSTVNSRCLRDCTEGTVYTIDATGVGALKDGSVELCVWFLDDARDDVNIGAHEVSLIN